MRRTVAELRKEMLEDGLGQPAKRDYSWRNRKREAKPHRVVGRACNVSDSADVRQLAAFAQKSFGHVDLWVRAHLFLVALTACGVTSCSVFWEGDLHRTWLAALQDVLAFSLLDCEGVVSSFCLCSLGRCVDLSSFALSSA